MRTALDVTPDELRGYIAVARRRTKAPSRREPDQVEVEAMRARAREVAVLLKARFGAHRVILFGSLAHGAWPTADSDVDLAVEGLSAEASWRAWAAAEDLFPDRAVHLVALEEATGSVRAAIQQAGIEM